MYYYLNGKIVPDKQAKISVNDIGLLRGYGVFDFLRTCGGKPFILQEHLNRLRRSAAAIGLKFPMSDQEVGVIIAALMKKNKLPEADIKIILTGGESKDGLNVGAKPTVIISTKPIMTYPAAYHRQGVKVITCEHQREQADAKTFGYVTMLKLNPQKIAAGAADILYLSKGKVLEGSRSNFFIFKKDTLVTAKDDILLGTRRQLALDLAKKLFKTEVRPIRVAELAQATEAFLTSTTIGILPVVSIDGKKVGDGKVGKNTKALMVSLDELLKEYSQS